MILIAGIRDADIERIKALMPGHAFPDEQHVIDKAFARGEITITEFAHAIQNLRADQPEECGFGSAICSGFFSAYMTMFPDSQIIFARSDPVAAIQELVDDDIDAWMATRGVTMGGESIQRALSDIPHVEVDMTSDPTDDEILAMLQQREKAA